MDKPEPQDRLAGLKKLCRSQVRFEAGSLLISFNFHGVAIPIPVEMVPHGHIVSTSIAKDFADVIREHIALKIFETMQRPPSEGSDVAADIRAAADGKEISFIDKVKQDYENRKRLEKNLGLVRPVEPRKNPTPCKPDANRVQAAPEVKPHADESSGQRTEREAP
jgi:hypothetical protein